MIRSSVAAASLAVLVPLAFASVASAAPPPATGAWDRVLHAHADRGGMDYAALAADRGDLDAFLHSLAGVQPKSMGETDALAFWINAYNAVVVEHVLERYPKIQSVKKVDGFFDSLTYPVAGRKMTLDAIEAAGRALGDPRIHFAVVCASTSCPDLRGEAYTGTRLDEQLDDQVRTFLENEQKGLRYDARANTAWLSSIFKWYAGDFTGGSTVVAFFSRGAVLGWVVAHAPKSLAATLKAKHPSVSYLDYDWSLNDRPAR